MTFENFLNGDISPFEMGGEMSKTLLKIGKYDLYVLNEKDHSYAAYDDTGVEYLFDMNKLCLIQYDISRIKKIIWMDREIQYSTTYEDFKNYLLELNIVYKEEIEVEQKIIITDTGIKVYFDNDNFFVTAIKFW